MKTKVMLTLFVCSFLLPDASAQIFGRRHKTTVKAEPADSIVLVETDVTVRQTSYLSQLKGDWNINLMKEQARMAPQSLNGVNLVINGDSTFTVFTPCGQAKGTFTLKGTGIKFTLIGQPVQAGCNTSAQTDLLLSLLQKRVSSYAVTDNSLVLLDGSANHVFEGVPGR